MLPPLKPLLSGGGERGWRIARSFWVPTRRGDIALLPLARRADLSRRFFGGAICPPMSGMGGTPKSHQRSKAEPMKILRTTPSGRVQLHARKIFVGWSPPCAGWGELRREALERSLSRDRRKLRSEQSVVSQFGVESIKSSRGGIRHPAPQSSHGSSP